MHPPDLKAIVQRLAGAVLISRHEANRIAVYRCQADAVAAGRTARADDPADIRAVCVGAVEGSVDLLWKTYRTVIVESRIPWTAEIRAHIMSEVDQLLATDVGYVEGLARNAIAQFGHGFDNFLTNAAVGIRARLDAELDLFASRYRPVGGSLLNLLSAPRYAGPQRHWQEVVGNVQGESTDVVTAAREALLAAEAMAKIVSMEPASTLGGCIKSLRKSGQLSEVLSQGVQALWNVANVTPGLRHAGTGQPEVQQQVAEYVVTLSEAVIRLLLGVDVTSGGNGPSA